MNYQTYTPLPDLSALVKCHWSLEVPAATTPQPQRIVPDGCMELIFILGDDIKRYTSGSDFIIQPRAMVVGQITEPFIIEPTGYVHCFATRFYPYGFANFIDTPIKDLSDRETPIAELFGLKQAAALTQKMIEATSDEERTRVIEAFLLHKCSEQATIDQVVKATVAVLQQSGGSKSITTMLKDDLSKRRQLERKFFKQVGMSPKQLGKVIRLQAALKLLLGAKHNNLTQIAYESEYYDQAHFIKDFKDFTGVTPKDFLDKEDLLLSSVFYTDK